MVKQVSTVPASSKDTKVATKVDSGDSWKSIGEIAASLAESMVRGAS